LIVRSFNYRVGMCDCLRDFLGPQKVAFNSNVTKPQCAGLGNLAVGATLQISLDVNLLVGKFSPVRGNRLKGWQREKCPCN
jgi:hypothetical protein